MPWLPRSLCWVGLFALDLVFVPWALPGAFLALCLGLVALPLGEELWLCLGLCGFAFVGFGFAVGKAKKAEGSARGTKPKSTEGEAHKGKATKSKAKAQKVQGSAEALRLSHNPHKTTITYGPSNTTPIKDRVNWTAGKQLVKTPTSTTETD